MAMHDLEVLDRIFQGNDATMTVFEINLSRFDELLDLLSPQVERGCEVPGGATIHKAVAMGLHLLAERSVSRDMSQLDERLPLERSGEAVGAIVFTNLVEGV